MKPNIEAMGILSWLGKELGFSPKGLIDDDLRIIIEEHKAVARVRELHKPIYISPNEYVCEYCTDDVGSYRNYPCSTIKALDGEQ